MEVDRWSLADLRSVPARLPGWLAGLVREMERLGKWPTWLAEGYTALIPKEGPPRPLNICPLTVLSMVRRLWVGVQTVDSIAWQGAWAHPAAFGLRRTRSTLEGAAATQVLLELCRPRGWAVAEMSIDYVKCFDLIPQALVLALALELGIDPGTCCALGALYRQLRRASNITGTFGLWWQATNGFLQGCPLSVILVNVLPTICKWEVDSLRCQVCAQAAPSPALDEDAAEDRETSGPVPRQRSRPRLHRAQVVEVRGRHPGGGPGRCRSPEHSPRDGGVAADHGAGRPRGQVLLGPAGTLRHGGAAPGHPDPTGDVLPPARRRHCH